MTFIQDDFHAPKKTAQAKAATVSCLALPAATDKKRIAQNAETKQPQGSRRWQRPVPSVRRSIVEACSDSAKERKPETCRSTSRSYFAVKDALTASPSCGNRSPFSVLESLVPRWYRRLCWPSAANVPERLARAVTSMSGSGGAASVPRPSGRLVPPAKLFSVLASANLRATSAKVRPLVTAVSGPRTGSRKETKKSGRPTR